MVLPRRLCSPNTQKNHWAQKRERDAWERLIAESDVRSDGSVCLPVTQRMRLEIVRLIPNRRFLMDKDNRDWSGKRLQDSLVALRYLVDDNAKHLDGPYVSQGLSTDKHYWTVVMLRPADAYVEDIPILSPTALRDQFLNEPHEHAPAPAPVLQ